MKKVTLWAGIAGLVVMASASASFAGPIQSACNQSTRSAATPALCSCIQRVADQTLRGADQRRVASFFKNPDKAQDVRMSKRSADDAFWERYTRFGREAEATCQG